MVAVQGGPHARVSSPSPGRSTLTTVAPRSASIMAANGPANTRLRSATRTPVSGDVVTHRTLMRVLRSSLWAMPTSGCLPTE